VLQDTLVKLATRLVGVREDGDAQANGLLGAGAADVRVHQVGTRTLDARVDVLPLQKSEQVRFVELGVLGFHLLGLAETGAKPDAVERRAPFVPLAIADERLPVGPARHAKPGLGSAGDEKQHRRQ
jgi:hypothetical protein